MEITIAIPNYNGLEGLKRLLPCVVRESFLNVFVLDDGSTDGSVSYIKKNYPSVTVVQGSENLGAGGNRNRILEQGNIGDVIWFVDADMELVTENVQQIIEEKFKDPAVGVVGWQILTSDNTPMLWNYGYEMNNVRDFFAGIYTKVGIFLKNKPRMLRFLQNGSSRFSFNIDILLGDTPERIVDWVAEGCFCVRTDLFKKIQGFDPNMRYHETHDFSKRIRSLDKIIKFSQDIEVRHLGIEVNIKNRSKEKAQSRKYFSKKYKHSDLERNSSV